MALKLGNVARITLGAQGESGGRPLRFDLSEWFKVYPDGIVTVMHQRHGESSAYAVDTIVDEEGILTWTPSGTDTAYAGNGLCQFVLTEGSTVVKSYVIPTKVHESLTVPEPEEEGEE